MELLSLLHNPITNVPIHYDSEGFRKAVASKLIDFKTLVDNSEIISSHPYLNYRDVNEYKKKIGVLINGLLRTIDNFYKGKPAQAYITFRNTMKAINITEYLDKNSRLPAANNLYRIRTTSGNYPLSKDELFHIPFEKRGIVKSQRFSIPGLPSLYTANSIYVAWEEMRRPNIDSIQAIRLVNQRDLRLLDLTSDIYNSNLKNDTIRTDVNTSLYKVLTWPLVACCSIKVKNSEDTFKPEYIIPQLLLQWVSENLDGIKYSSTHIDLNKVRHTGTFHNVVLPVKTFNLDYGYCNRLKTLFKGTDVLPMQLRQFATYNDRFNHQASIRTDVNLNVSELELIEGTSQYYSQTLFGVLEHGLNGLEIHDL